MTIFVNMRAFLFSAYLLFLPLLSAASPLPLTEGGIIVQFSRPVEAYALAELSAGRFTDIRALNPDKTLYVFRYKTDKTPAYKAIETVRNLPFYSLHQEDGPVHLRATLPNDSLFAQQWHLPLIRATEAWDITRSGVNGNGDTIVIAVIDDGLHTNHPDFGGNIWINYADTAGNGIDDDNNGFIDDHYGWNFMSQNNDISDSNYYRAGHGTPVAGIIGARGNNITGITGIMWRVKLMIVNFTDTSNSIAIFQSDVLKAYQYVLHQRKLYNASGGKQGAYVVATNASWGVDGKFPNQAPLWCSMYDSLGKYGILNTGAVSNDPQNQVDSDGDLPTLCTSEHLITVGSTTSNDNYFSSGYSSVSVDLSAPGYNVFSSDAYTSNNVRLNRLYRNGFHGTSFATPMVTAAIGILHAHACARILDSMRVNPAKGNAILRKMLLEGVDVLDGLAGKNATSGRLNIKKALEIMDQYCYGYVGVDAPETKGGPLLYPNPGNGLLSVLSDDLLLSVRCYDLSGREMPVAVSANDLDIRILNAGVYVFHIQTAERVYTIRYLKSE